MKNLLVIFVLTFALIQVTLSDPTRKKGSISRTNSRSAAVVALKPTDEEYFKVDLAENDEKYSESINTEFKIRELKSNKNGVSKHIIISEEGDFVKMVNTEETFRTILKYKDGRILTSWFNVKTKDEFTCTRKTNGEALVTMENVSKDLKTAFLYDNNNVMLEEALLDKQDLRMIQILESAPYRQSDSTDLPREPKNDGIRVTNFYRPPSTFSKEMEGDITVKTKNAGIIANDRSVVNNGYDGCPEQRDLSDLTTGGEFEDISRQVGRLNDPQNSGYLVHYSRIGKHWRTKSKDIIQKILGGDTSLINDCGYTEYFDTAAKIKWSINEGIIENDKFIKVSRHFRDRGDYLEYQWEGNMLKWSKGGIPQGNDNEKNGESATIPDSHPPLARSESKKSDAPLKRSNSGSRKTGSDSPGKRSTHPK